MLPPSFSICRYICFIFLTELLCTNIPSMPLSCRIQTDKLQRVLNAAVRLVSNTRKYDRGLMYIQRNVLHWLNVTDCVHFRVCVQMFECLHGMASDYLSTMCHPASRLPGRQNLCSANRGQLDVPCATLSSCGVRAFAHAGPSLWNTLPVHLKNRNLTLTTFMCHLTILSLISFLSTDFVLSAFGV